MEKLLEFATSVPDFRRTGKGNIRHKLEDVLILIILARISKCIGRADIIEFGRHNLTRFRSIGMLKNGVPSELTMSRIENGIDESSRTYYIYDGLELIAVQRLVGYLCVGFVEIHPL